MNEAEYLIVAKGSLVLAKVFALSALLVRVFTPSEAVLLAWNGALSIVFGFVTTYCWMSYRQRSAG